MSDAAFQWESARSRVVAAPGAISALSSEAEAVGVRRPLIVASRRTLDGPVGQAVLTALGELSVAIFDEVVEHSDTEAVARGARLAADARRDGLVAIGGGSASDTAKGIAILLAEGGRIEEHASSFVPPDHFVPKPLPNPKLPLIAVPTTASAAEVTPGLGIKDAAGVKRLYWDVKLAARLIILDPALNAQVPAELMASTGMNAFAHCAEGLYSRVRNPISEGVALQGIRILARALPDMVARPDDVEARFRVQTGAHLSGQVISNARVGIHHAVCHCLGARGGLSHGTANAIMLPHALAYNLDVAAVEIGLIADAMGVAQPGASRAERAQAALDAIRDMQAATRVPARLRDTGLDQSLLPAIAEDTMKDRGLYFNPKPTARSEDVLGLLEAAW